MPYILFDHPEVWKKEEDAAWSTRSFSDSVEATTFDNLKSMLCGLPADFWDDLKAWDEKAVPGDIATIDKTLHFDRQILILKTGTITEINPYWKKQ